MFQKLNDWKNSFLLLSNELNHEFIEDEYMKTVIIKGKYSGDVWIGQSSLINGQETDVDLVRLSHKQIEILKKS